MSINREQFLEQGFLVIPNIIPIDKLEAMRSSCEIMLERQKVVWARDRKPDEPLGGNWESSMQPRVHIGSHGIIDRKTANVVEDFWVADKILDISNQMLCSPEGSILWMWFMCNPV